MHLVSEHRSFALALIFPKATKKQFTSLSDRSLDTVFMHLFIFAAQSNYVKKTIKMIREMLNVLL